MHSRPTFTVPVSSDTDLTITVMQDGYLDFDIYDEDGYIDRTVTYTTDEVAHFLKESGMLDAIRRVR